MIVTLISLDQEIFTFGIRSLSSYLRSSGVDVRLVFLPIGTNVYSDEGKFRRTYPPQVLDDLYALCADSDLIGISLMTNQFLQAVQVTRLFKERGLPVPVIWGGIQPTIEPEECLKYADLVCVGEGEEALLEVVQRIEKGQPLTDVQNIWTRVDGVLHRNPLRPLVQNLDRFPIPDYSCQNHYIIQNSRLVLISPEILRAHNGDRFQSNKKGVFYPVMTSRGCPYACTYCCNHTYDVLYPHQRRLRWRSVEHVMEELKTVNEIFGPIRLIMFVDDNFTARPLKDLSAFCDAYKQQIGIPFFVQISPLTITEEKLLVLLDAGCIKTTMGIETASERIAGIYNRSHFHKVNDQAIKILRKHMHRMALPPTFQFIIDNPEETLEETLSTLRMAAAMPRPWINSIYSLMLFPGTILYDQAMAKGLITDKTSQLYGRNWTQQSQPYFQIWIRLYRANFPVFVMNAMLAPWLARLMTSRPARALLNTPLLKWLAVPTSTDSRINRFYVWLVSIFKSTRVAKKPATPD